MCSALFVAALFGCGCGKQAPAAHTAPNAQRSSAQAATATLPEVKAYGALHAMMHEGKTAAEIHIQQLAPAHVYAVGALSELRGEVTIVDSKIWLAYPNGASGERVESPPSSDEGAALLVSSIVPNWSSVPIDEDIEPAQLESTIERIAKSHGVDIERRFALRIEGPLANVAWHVIDGSRATPETTASHEGHMQMAVREQLPEASATVVGFFSKNDQGVFTHMGANTHLHWVDATNRRTGHLDSVKVLKHATLWLPAAAG
jgi:acetolactate decarboxylase